MNVGIALMAKAPLRGLAKTRLAPRLGEQGAAALADRLLDHAVAQAAAAAPGRVILWVTPDHSHPAFQRQHARHGVLLRTQPPGDLGARMLAVFTAESPLLLMGTDAPALDTAMLHAAATALLDHDAVFVPALDGGYALIGLQQPMPALFADMPWSTPQVIALTRQRLRAAGLRHAELAPVPDIDEPADLVHLPPGWA